MFRYMVRRSTNEVFIWTPQLALRNDLEEVMAPSPAIALKSKTVPNPRSITLEQIEEMTKTELIMYARLKLGVELNESLTSAELQDRVKEAMLLAPAAAAAMVVQNTAGPFGGPADMRVRSGMQAAGVMTPTGGAVAPAAPLPKDYARDLTDQPLR